MSKPSNIASFMLRFTQELWRDGQGEPHLRWRGHIRHVQGSEEERFTDFAEAVAFIQRYLTQLTIDSLAGDGTVSQEKVFQESFKLWEKFASSYSEMMSKAMEQTVTQSEKWQEQLDEVATNALKAWGLPVHPGQDKLLDALNDLQTQIQTLTKKVEQLESQVQKSNQTSQSSSGGNNVP